MLQPRKKSRSLPLKKNFRMQSKLATKEELKTDPRSNKNQIDIKEIRETMATKDDIRKILGAIDAFARKSENYDRKALVHDHRLRDHEVRILHLEKTASK